MNADGSYSIPAGNMFPPGTAGTRPEIYAMGFRNPFRMSVDKATGVVYLGDYGPDAGGAEPARGPGGQVEFNRITAPGNYGWPYCTGTTPPPRPTRTTTSPPGRPAPKFDCAGGPVNNSPHNTGLTEPARPAAAWINYDGCSGLPQFGCGGGVARWAAPVYRYDARLNSSTSSSRQRSTGTSSPASSAARWIKTIDVNADGRAGAIDDFPWRGTQVMDMAFGPDGALYVLDYGTGWFSGDANSALYRIEYIGAGEPGPDRRRERRPDLRARRR